jgi:hypothetical protein
MTLKELLKNSIQGTGEVTETLMRTTTDIVKEGEHDIEEIFGAVIELGKDGAVDVTEGVKGVFIGSVRALEDSGKSTEEAVEHVSGKAVSAVGKVTQDAEKEVGDAARKGIDEAKEIVKEPFTK